MALAYVQSVEALRAAAPVIAGIDSAAAWQLQKFQ